MVLLSMSELITWCKEQGMAIGTARGSVGGSRVAYVTDIIDLNPETWHTVFSRFCNEHRVEIGCMIWPTFTARCSKKYSLNCWNVPKSAIPQRKDEKRLNVMVAKAERNCRIAHG